MNNVVYVLYETDYTLMDGTENQVLGIFTTIDNAKNALDDYKKISGNDWKYVLDNVWKHVFDGEFTTVLHIETVKLNELKE